MYKNWLRFTKFSLLIIPIILVIILASINFLASFGMQILIDGALTNQVKNVVIGALILFFTAVIYGFSYYNSQKINVKLESLVFMKVKEHCLHAFLSKPLLEIEKTKTMDMYIKLEDDAKKFSEIFSKSILPIINLVFTLLIGSIYILIFSWQIFIICIVSVISIVLLNSIITKNLSTHINELQELGATEVRWSKDVYYGKDIINIFGARTFLKNKLDNILTKKIFHVKSKEQRNSLNFAVNDSGILIIECVIFFVGVILVSKKAMSIGVLIGIHNAAIGTFIWPVTDFPAILNSIKEQKVAYSRLEDLLLADMSDKSENLLESNYKYNNSPGTSLSLEKVSFSYQDNQSTILDENKILNEINISFPKTGVTLIFGESGSGKTTLLKILLGLYPINSGEILKDNIKLTSDDLTNIVSYAPQGYSILPISIKENILLGETLADDDLEKLCKIVGLHDWVMKLPDKYNTVIKKENSMSVGQAARIAIVRALVKDSEFIILDEPFAGLDENIIHEISTLLKEISAFKSVIIVSHREPPDFLPDRIFEQKGGEIYAL